MCPSRQRIAGDFWEQPEGHSHHHLSANRGVLLPQRRNNLRFLSPQVLCLPCSMLSVLRDGQSHKLKRIAIAYLIL